MSSTWTPYDTLRHANNQGGILAYTIFALWNIISIGAGGPVAATVGARRTGNAVTHELLTKSFGVSAVAALLVSVGVTLARVTSSRGIQLFSKPRQRRMVIDREEYVSRQEFGFGHYSRETSNKHTHLQIDIPDFYGGPVLSTILTVGFVLSLLAIWIGYLSGIAAAVASLCTKLFVGQVLSWVVIASLLPGSFMVTAFIGLHSPKRLWPSELVIAVVSAVIFAKLCEVQDHTICTLRDAASCGAAFGTIMWLARLPLSLLLTNGQANVGVPLRDPGNRWTRMLFPPYVEEQQSSSETIRIPMMIPDAEVQEALQLERVQLEQNPGYNKVFWSRPEGVDKASHYVLIVGHYKYELRDVSRLKDRSQIRYLASKIAYEHDGLHRALLSTPGQPGMFAWYDCLLIGWTQLPHEEIDRICSELGQRWKYRLFWRGRNGGNCQHFLRAVGEQIISKDLRASNWDWFRHDRMGPIQCAQELSMFQARQDRDRRNQSFSRGGLLEYGSM